MAQLVALVSLDLRTLVLFVTSFSAHVTLRLRRSSAVSTVVIPLPVFHLGFILRLAPTVFCLVTGLSTLSALYF